MELRSLGFDGHFAHAFETFARAGMTPGRVLLQYNHLYTVATEKGEVRAQCAGRLRHDAQRHELPVTGDWVTLQRADGFALIEAVLPRRSSFGRKAASVKPPAVRAGDGVEEIDVQRIPQRYRPPTQKSPRQTERRNGERASSRPVPSEVISGIRVRLSFDRFGFCSFSLLLERSADLDEEVAVTTGDQHLRLFAQEIWYQDLPFSSAATQLRQGLELTGRLADDRRARWLLTGRDLYVLASHQRATGFISTNRLSLGRSHVVLCIAEMLQAVEAILREAGCSDYAKLDESEGVPPGWVALRGVSPHRAISLGSGSDPFYAIKPAPDIEIELEGGLWLQHSGWLAGYPPRIKLLGDLNVGAKILIDGKEAMRAEDGSLTADGYDRCRASAPGGFGLR